MKRTIFDDQHDAFREVFRGFLHREVVPEFAKWEEQGYAPREFYRKLGELGVMGFDIPEEYGGAGATSYRYLMIIGEEAALAGVSLGNYHASAGIVLPYLLTLANEDQKKRWLPACASGQAVLAVAMTEAGDGFGSGRHSHHREALRRRRKLHPQRRKDLYHQRLSGDTHGRGRPYRRPR